LPADGNGGIVGEKIRLMFAIFATKNVAEEERRAALNADGAPGT